MLVEGKVLSVRESGGTIYMNFARRWTQDFSVSIVGRLERNFRRRRDRTEKRWRADASACAAWIEQRSGPIIEAAAPEQIEIVH